MKESTTVMAGKTLEMGCLESKNVITRDGRIIGVLTGGWVDPSTWTLTDLVVELDKNVADEVNVKKSMLRSVKVTVPTKFVSNVSDVVQLNTDIASLSGALTPIEKS